MTGSRKFRFALLALAALVAGFGVAVWRKADPELFDQYAFGLFLLTAGFGGANGIEHLAAAYGARRKEPKP